MANWIGGRLTKVGNDLQIKVEAGLCKLELTKIKLGDGTEGLDAIETMTDLVGPKAVFGISSVVAKDDMCTVTGVISSSNVTAAFYAREWGIFAKDPDRGEILYMISLDPNPESIPPKTAALKQAATYAMNIVVANAANIEARIDPQGLVTTEILEKAAGLVRRNMDYFLTDKVFDIQLSAHPSWRLVCTKAGTTSGVLLNLHGAKLGDTYADGTAEWTVKDAYEATVDAHNKAPDAHADIRRILDDKAPIASPALTGTPTTPTASKGTNTDQIASTAFVTQAVAALNGLDSMDKLAKEIEGKLGQHGIVAGNLEANGWIKFADGLIVQWGIIKEVHFDSTDIPVTFPIAFSKSCFVVIPTLHQPIATGGSITAFIKRGTITLQGCTCVADHSNERPTGDMFFLTIGI